MKTKAAAGQSCWNQFVSVLTAEPTGGIGAGSINAASFQFYFKRFVNVCTLCVTCDSSGQSSHVGIKGRILDFGSGGRVSSHNVTHMSEVFGCGIDSRIG